MGHAHLSEARLVVLLMIDQPAAVRVVDMLRSRVAPAVPVLMRTRYLAEREGLLKIGARDVVAEEVEGAVEVIARLLRSIEMPRNLIDQSIAAVRAQTHTSDRKQTVPRVAKWAACPSSRSNRRWYANRALRRARRPCR